MLREPLSIGWTVLGNSSRSKKEQKYLAFHEHYAKLVNNTDTSYWENWK
jgi:hypothetical protein